MKNLKKASNNTNSFLAEPIKLELYEEDDYMNVRIADGLKYRLVSFRNEADGSILVKFWTGEVGTGYKLERVSSGHFEDLRYRLKRK